MMEMNWTKVFVGGVVAFGVYKLFGDKIMSAFGAEAGVPMLVKLHMLLVAQKITCQN